jgi:DNA-directed RNA polymerase, mitochondrial
MAAHQPTPREWTEAELSALQQELEETAFAEGRANFQRKHDEALQKGQGTRSQVLQKLMTDCMDRVEKAIEFWHMEQTTVVREDGTRVGRQGRPHLLVRWVELVGAQVLAYLTVLEIFDGIAAKRPMGRAAADVAIRVQDEARYRRFKLEAAGLWKYRAQKNKRTRNRRHIKYSTDQSLRWAGVDDSDLIMSPNEQHAVGEQLLDLAVASTGWFDVVEKNRRSPRGGTRITSRFLMATPEILRWIARRKEVMETLFPVAPPMVVEPLPWTPAKRGGYRHNLAGHYPMLRGVPKSVAKAALSDAGPEVFAALNALQRVRWAVNQPVLMVVQELWRVGGGRAGLPHTEPLPLPLKPAAWAAMTQEEQTVWKRKASSRYEAERERASDAFNAQKKMAVAERLAAVPAHHYCWSLDFRGRLYPISTYLQPQGNDLCRGLLTFADTKPLGDTGLYWLLIHGANVLDEMDGVKVSKLSNDERVAFVQDRADRLLAAAADPLANLWWQDMENPFQVLAFCYEYARLREWVDAGHSVEEFASSLPVMLDGTCNGAQHWSAALRDSKGGASVNLLPSARPRDMYSDVCDEATRLLESMHDDMARMWLTSGFVTRKLVKVPSMTYFYGSGKFGFAEQMLSYFRKDPARLRAARAHFGKRMITGKTGAERETENLPLACQFMADVLDEALARVVERAYQGRQWLQHRARLLAARGQVVAWQVPITGLRVRQHYHDRERHRVNTMVSGRRVQASYWRETKVVNRVRQVNGVAPNVIHSLDAAALMLTVAHASAHGIQHIAMIHDSYGTHAGDTEVMRRVTREAFVRLYTEVDVVADLEQQLVAQIGDLTDDELAKWVPVPAHGDLDIGQVMVSDYFFA